MICSLTGIPVRGVLWDNPSAHCVHIHLYDWFKKQTDWPIAEQDKVGWESQIENDRMRKGRVRRVARQMENEKGIQNGIKVITMIPGTARR